MYHPDRKRKKKTMRENLKRAVSVWKNVMGKNINTSLLPLKKETAVDRSNQMAIAKTKSKTWLYEPPKHTQALRSLVC
jgi:hypothetical protein